MTAFFQVVTAELVTEMVPHPQQPPALIDENPLEITFAWPIRIVGPILVPHTLVQIMLV